MRAVGPAADPVPCSGCGRLLDPLRAGHVAIFDQRLHYFCDRSTCREAFLASAEAMARTPSPPRPPARSGSYAPSRVSSPGRTSPTPPVPATPLPPSPSPSPAGSLPHAVAAPIRNALPSVAADDALPDLPLLGDDPSSVEPVAQTVLHETPALYEAAAEAREGGALLLLMAVVSGTLAVALALAGDTPLVLAARIMLAAVGAALLVGRAVTSEREACDVHPVAALSGPCLAVAVAAWAALGTDRSVGSEAASLAGTIVTACAVGSWMLEHARRMVHAERGWIHGALAIPGHRDEGDGIEATREPTDDLRAGETVIVEEDEDVPVDCVVAGGDVEVLPWLGATTTLVRRNGDPIVAGAHVVRGRLRATCSAAGTERAFARILLDPRRRVDALANVARQARVLAGRWAPVAAIGCGLLALALGRTKVEVAMTIAAVQSGLATSVLGALPSVHVVRGILLALRRGITYRSADAWERAAQVGVGVFCARGTLLLGEPELAEIEIAAPRVEPLELLALAAGTERGQRHPVATAIVRAAKTRDVKPDAVRSVTEHQGLGVTGVTSGGEEICVGSRALLLEARVSVAAVERRVAELEAMGRTVVLVALGGRLVGLLALQDGLRPGARAAVQHLLDAQVEPVLLSGDSRETCEAIARTLDVEHVRPEILPGDRAAEVKRIAEAGASVAVLGHPGLDEGPLGAADVAVALGAAGAPSAEWGISLASEDVRDAALSLALAKRSRAEARAGFALAAVPPLVGAAIVGVGILPPAFVPLASLLGGAMGIAHSRAIDRLRNPPPPEPEGSGDPAG